VDIIKPDKEHSMGIDFHTYSLKITDGAEVPATGEYQVMASSLKSHRHRKGEILAFLLDRKNSSAIPELELRKINSEAGKAFFETPGSVTNALQRAAGSINSALLERNLKAESGEPVYAAACFVVVHNGYLFTAQTGGSHILEMGNDAFIHFQSADTNDRGLGAARRFTLNFQQSALAAGDLVILSTQIPNTWDEEHLKGSQQISMEQVYRRLMNQLNMDLQALVIKCKEGKGIAQEEMWLEQAPRKSPEQPPVHQEEQIPENVEKRDDPSLGREEKQNLPDQNRIPDGKDDLSMDRFFPEEEEATFHIEPGKTERTFPTKKDQPFLSEPRKITKDQYAKKRLTRSQDSQPDQKGNIFKEFFIKLSSRLTADSNPLEGSGSTKMLSTIVIVIPLLLITAAVLVYTYSGRREQHQTYLAEAQSYITQATTIEDAAQQREYWKKAYDTVLKAREFGDSDLSDTLLTQTQTIIDDMDLVTRLDFRPATTSQFSQDVVLTKIKSNNSGIYLLDSAAGRIYRTVATSKGFYDIDSSFQCGPGTYGVITVGKIVDFTTLPTNTRSYELLAVDAGGNLLYCSPENDPVPGSLIPPEDEWEKIAAMSLDEYTLYVVDAEKDRIWSYAGRDFEIAAMAGIVFSTHPVDYLGTQTVDLGGVLDLIVNKEDMFILHQDSHMTTCQYNAYRDGNPTECQDPTPYSDSRVGYEKNPLIYFDAQFKGIQETTYPTSAFYILDAANRAVLQYSYQLNLERTLKPQPSKTYPLPETDMTGVGISTTKELFLAFGNQLYVGGLP
jgi:type II secretory pathway pseudopilin PulG